MKIIEKYKEYRKYRRRSKLLKWQQSVNDCIRTYKYWEHNSWGDSIVISKINENGTFAIHGWLRHRPNNGDWLEYECQSGKTAKGMITNVEHCSDPNDMFFAEVIPFDYI